VSVEKSELIIPESRVDRVSAYHAPVIPVADPIMAIIERMTREPSFDIERIKEMLAMKERFEALEAKKSFVADMAEFKKNPPQIYKNKHVGFDSKRTGERTAYDHATHSEVTMKIIAEWMRKAYGAAQEGATVVCLVPARTDTVWWHEYAMKSEILLIKGRLKFGDADNSAPFPSAIVVFRPREFRLVSYG
jgi:site-specific DNA-methyltransferase (adenine-specific)